MHYFKKNIGDYAKKAGRLSMLQHGSYTLLVDACYDREQFPTHEEAIEWTWASTKEEVEAVEFVLRKFFKLIDGRYVEADIQADIAEYHAKAETNKRIALERETNRKARNTNRAQAVHDTTPNHKPETNNQKEPPIPPKGGEPEAKDESRKRQAAVSLKTYLEECKHAGQKAIPEGHAVFAYAAKVGIPDEFLRLHWLEFRERYTMPDAKRYKSWPTVFHKSVKGNWFHLWYAANDGSYALTTVGQQAQRNHQEAA